MIKINLLPVKEKKKRKDILIYFGMGLFYSVLVLILIWYSFGRYQTEKNLKDQIEKVNEESKGLEKQINEIKDLQAKEANLDSSKKTEKTILEGQRKILTAVDQMALNLSDGIWLTSIIQGKDKDWNKFTIQGYAFSPMNLQKYLGSLQKPGSFFKEVTLAIKNISAAVGNNKQIQQFEINMRIID